MPGAFLGALGGPALEQPFHDADLLAVALPAVPRLVRDQAAVAGVLSGAPLQRAQRGQVAEVRGELRARALAERRGVRAPLGGPRELALTVLHDAQGVLQAEAAVLLTGVAHAAHRGQGPVLGVAGAGHRSPTSSCRRAQVAAATAGSSTSCCRNALICGIRASARSASGELPAAYAPISTSSRMSR